MIQDLLVQCFDWMAIILFSLIKKDITTKNASAVLKYAALQYKVLHYIVIFVFYSFLLKYCIPWSETIVNMLHIGKNKHFGMSFQKVPLGDFGQAELVPGAWKSKVIQVLLLRSQKLMHTHKKKVFGC